MVENEVAPKADKKGESAVLWDAQRLQSVHAQADKAHRVQRMFNAIAPTYERVNAVFSLGRDRAWRKYTVRNVDVPANGVVLDIACGSGDMVRAFAWWTAAGRIVGLDFAEGMLREAAAQPVKAGAYCGADGLSLPVRDGVADVVSCAFGVRNFQDLGAGLREMHRVLRPGGRATILEFSRPRNGVVRGFYEFYARRVMPRGAAWLSRDRTGAYRYLPESVVSFPSPEEMCAELRAAGFKRATARPLTFGVVTVYVGEKSA